MTAKLNKRHRGFTLIEALIVILMSMTLMAASIFQLQVASMSSRGLLFVYL
jgi:type II secretory pathway pseudopilin PulG